MTRSPRCLCLFFVLMLTATAGLSQEQPGDGPMNHGAMPQQDEAMPAHGNMGHGDHVPKFGGLVLMYGLRHFEILAKPDGAVELHLSDAMRTPMPAVTVSDVTVEVERPGGVFEYIAMAVSEAGDYWHGSGDPIDDPDNTTVHLAFIAFGAPYVYALPLDLLQAEDAAPDDSKAADTVAEASSGKDAA